MTHLAGITAYLLHPLIGRGYQLWSGIGSDVSEVAVIGAAWAILRRHNCHVPRCWRLQWKHTAAGDGVCRRHHPDEPKSHEQILADHHQAKRDAMKAG